MKQLCIILLCISSAILPASTNKTLEEIIKFPDSNIILYTLESSYVRYLRENLERNGGLLFYNACFAKYAKKLANKTLTVAETKLIIAESSFSDYLYQRIIYDPHLQPTQDYILAVLSKYRIE